ncbi:Dual specificity phosphatase catalytic domain [Trinorchestia longiramus]|nr:Dual specificity phosphatase catalytic domain [Trinorchestia longiramus]
MRSQRRTSLAADGDTDAGVENTGRVYVHCKAGRTRSACLVACYLMQVYGLTPMEAVEHMTSKRPHVWLGRQQHSAIQTFYESLMRNRGQ